MLSGTDVLASIDRPAADQLAADQLAADQLASDQLAVDELAVDQLAGTGIAVIDGRQRVRCQADFLVC